MICFNDQKPQKFGYVFPKRLHTTLKKCLSNRSKRFGTTTEIFLVKFSDLQKLQKNIKNSYVFEQIDKSILAKKNYITSFFVNNFFHQFFMFRKFWTFMWTTIIQENLLFSGFFFKQRKVNFSERKCDFLKF